MAKVKINCYTNKSDLEAEQDLRGTISFVMSTKEIYLGKEKYCDATSEIASAVANYYTKAEVDQKLADLRSETYKVDSLTLNNNVLSIGQVNPSGTHLDPVSVNIPTSSKPTLVWAEGLVTIERWGEKDISSTYIYKMRSGAGKCPSVPIIVLDGGSAEHPEIKTIRSMDGSADVTCRCTTITFEDSAIAYVWRTFLDRTIQSYQHLSSVTMQPRAKFIARNGAVMTFTGRDRNKYSFNPHTFFNPDFSSKMYTIYDDQKNIIYTFSFKPEFKVAP